MLRLYYLHSVFLEVDELQINRQSVIDEAFSQASTLQKNIIVSFVHKINKINPITFYSYNHENYKGKKFFWKHATDAESIVGLGAIFTIKRNEIEDRFLETITIWNDLIKDSIVYNDFSVEGVGPVLLGGLSFLPLSNEHRTIWNNYHDLYFFIPELMLTVKDETFITENYLIDHSKEKPLVKDIDSILDDMRKINNDGYNNPNVLSVSEDHPQEWKTNVQLAIDKLKNRELEKIVLARELVITFDRKLSYKKIIQNLIDEQQGSYIFSIEHGTDCYLGASPERLVRKINEQVYSVCLAGSTPRGKSCEEDERLGVKLLNDEKNLNEHQYVVDMIRKSLSKVCRSVKVPKYPKLLKMRDIQHLYTPVQGVVRENVSIMDIVKELHPTPALGGTPKNKALELIPKLEFFERGLYAAPVGWIDYEGNGEFIVAIRSGLLKGDKAFLFAGCGIVADSLPESEYAETEVKFRPMLRALGGSET